MPTLLAVSAYKSLPEAVPGLVYACKENVVSISLSDADDQKLARKYQAAIRHMQHELSGIEGFGYNQKRVGSTITFEVF
jgi:hypothetical protein